ncbi:hypothetical protein SPRG_20889 [Saprolegnia parasitica CBS 223.65]|uniref:Uncharacterized protein n=1 Tax=Saprolegnia parasitica (strain CBS 223.65) TaxID=695850 RepID=A0A067BZE6_SAPPC|nr:hypothetical protein SPRG_20889 [Saprolegnia parasitica CBS 223.65]KDO23914.1 hypothetical protein SPRG_20889 [Saprolegnia parasitica CBS 223.65]|eukprot:XP_012205414.1 hypothetical protein SPRG_20889 [Saprolegnia parasitica CBS 223.65]
MCITYVDGTTVPEAPLRDADDSTSIDADAVPIARMEPIVLYALCQLTTYLYSSAVDKYAPLLSLLVDHGERGAVLAIVECVLPHLPRLSPDDVQSFLKNYVAFNKDLRSIVAMLHTNLYFALDPRLPLVVQYLADTGSVDRDEMIAVVQTALEQSCCVHPLLLPALCDQVPVSYAATAKHYAVATLQTLKKTLLWQAKPTAEPSPDVDGVCAVIRRHYHVLQSPTILQYWLVLVLTIPEWYTRPAYRAVVDAIVALATPTMLSALEAPFSLYYDALCLLPGARSFVPPPTASVWSVFSGTTATDLHFSYLALLLEPGKQKAKTIESLRAKGRLATELYVYGVETAHPGAYGQRDLEFASFSTLRLFRVAQIVLACPNNTPMLVLWWQLWFALYFASIGSTFFGHHVWDLEAKQLPRRSLQAKLRQLSAHFSAQVVSHPSPYASELARLYSAMDAWLENTDVGLWMGHKESLPPHYCIGHATQLLQLSHVLLHTSDTMETRSEALCDRVAPLLWVRLCLPAVTVASSPSSNASSAVASPVSVLPSLRPVVWPEPIPMKRFKYLRFSPSLPTTPGPLPLELAPGPFVDRAMQYTDVLSQLTALETDFVEKLAKLYVPKLVVVTTSVPCAGRKGKDPAPCKRPSVLRLEYTEWHLDDASADVLATCQLQATRLNVPSLRLLSAPIAVVGDRGNYLQLGALDVQICFQILLIDSVVALLTSDPAAWQAQGVAWFHALLHLDSKVVRRCPPFQEVLWRSIQALGVAFIGVDQEETSGLLRFMLQDPARVVLLSDCFFPNNTPTRFVEYFATVMYHTPDLSTDDRLQLLRRFDIAKWLQASPTIFDRDTLLSIVLAELVLGQPSAEVHRMHAKTLHTLCSLFLEEHVDKVLCALLGVYDQYYAPDLQAMRTYFECSSSVSTSKPLDVGLWQAVAHVPNELWADLPLETLQLLVERVTSHVLARRSAGHDRLLAQQDWKKHGDDSHSASADVYELSQWQAAHVLKPCLDLVVVWVRAQATAEMMWSITSKVFEAMLQVLYMPSAPEPVRALAPWPSTDDATPATVASSLWSCLQSFLERDTMAMQIKLDCIWSLMCNVLWPHAPDSLVKAYVPLLGRVPWDQWALHEETLNTMKDCLTVSTASMVTAYAIKFQSPLRLHVLLVLRDMLSRSPWPSTYLDAQPAHVQSSFFVKYHLLLIHVAVHHRDHTLPRSFASFLSHPRRLARPIKSAEVDAVANGCRALLLHPTLLCAPVDAVADAHARYVAALRLLLSLCGLDLAERQGDELKKASTLLHLLALLLHPTGPDWKLARDAVGHHNVYAAVVASLASAAAVVTYDVLSLLHVHRSNFEAVFKPEHLQSLYADVFRMANVPVVDGAFQQRLAVAHTWMGLGDALHTVCDELRPSEASAVPLLEGHVEVLAPMASVGAIVASMLLSLATLHELESVKAACAAVASVHVMASLCERSLASYVTKGLSWQPIVVDGVKVPELSAVEFVASCLERYTFLPLVAYCLQQDAAVAKAPWQEKPPLELQLCARFVEYVERACSVDDHMPREAEPALLFLCTTLFCLVLRLESVAMAFKQDMLSRVLRKVVICRQHRHSKCSFKHFITTRI